MTSLISSKVSFSAILIDLDSFKQINDTYGHKEGDSALQEVYHLLSETFGRKDTITRFGGDEFCIVSEINDPSQLDSKVVELRSAVKRFNDGKKKPYPIRFSIGYAVHDSVSSEDLSTFLKRIDSLMYEEKAIHHSRRS